MKKINIFILSSLLVLLVGCGAKKTTSDVLQVIDNPPIQMETAKPEKPLPSASQEVDLTALSSTMVYAEVYNMVSHPERYIGKTVKMRGPFSVYEGQTQNYYACLITDAAACCAQGIEFILDGDYQYPKDYPDIGSTVTVTGVFDSYTEDGSTYCRLLHASFVE